MVKLDAKVIVHRVLRHMTAFKSPPDIDHLRHLTAVPLSNGQRILGAYENHRGSDTEVVLVTHTSLWVNNGDLKETRYANMVNATWSPREKRFANAVQVELQDGTTALVKVLGRQDGGADVFEFLRFLLRVIGAREG